MTEVSVVNSLIGTSPIAVAVIFVVILFLRRQKEVESDRAKSERALLDLYEKNQTIMNNVLDVIGGVKEVINKCKGPNSNINIMSKG